MSANAASPRADAEAVYRKDAKDLVAGLVDGALRLQFVGSKSAQPRLRVRVTSANERAIDLIRESWASKLYVVRAKKAGGTATADFDGDEAISVLRYVSRRGVVHRRAAEIALSILKGKKDGTLTPEEFETARAELEKELSAVSESVERTREVRRINRKRKAGSDDPDVKTEPEEEPEKKFVTESVPTEEEVAKIVDLASEHRKWIEGFSASASAFRPATETDAGKRKIGRIVMATNKFPRGAAVASAIHEIVGGGKVGLTRPRIAFTTKKDLSKLRESFGTDRSDIVNFDALI